MKKKKVFALRFKAFIVLFIMCIIALQSALSLDPSYGNILTYYKFDDTITDSSTRGQHLQVAAGAAAYTAGKLSNALDCDADRFTNASSSYNLNTIRAVEYWVKFDTLVSNRAVVHWASGDAPDEWYWSAGASSYRSYLNGTLHSLTTLSTSKWYHFAHFMNLDRRYLVYLNGTMIYNASTTANLTSGTAYSICGYATGGDLIDGQIDNFIIYNTIPDNATVQQWVNEAYNGGLGRVPTPQIINSSFNVTSYQYLISNSTEWNTYNYINVSAISPVAFTFQTNTPLNASCSIFNFANYSEAIANDPDYKLATSMAISHSYTLADTLSFYQNQCVYCEYYDGIMNAESGCLKIMASDIGKPNIMRNASSSSQNSSGNYFNVNFTITDQSTIGNTWFYGYFNRTGGDIINISLTLDSGLYNVKYPYNMTNASQFCYYGFAYDVWLNYNNTPLYCENLILTRVSPSSPFVYAPVAGLINGDVTVNYTNSSVYNPEDTKLDYYLIYLADSSQNELAYIANNSLNLGYIVNVQNITDANYRIKVYAFDNNSRYSTGYSAIFRVNKTNAAEDQSFQIGGCPVTGVAVTVIAICVFIALFFIAIGYIMQNMYLPIFGWVLLIVSSYYLIGCVGLYAGIIILISVLMILLTAISIKNKDF